MPVWLRRMASRRSTSMAAVASWPGSIGALDDPGVVAVQAGQPVGGVDHHRGAGVGADDAGVAHLAAALGVEGRAVEEDRHLVAVAGDDGEHGGLGLHLLAADELGGAVVVEDLLEAGAVGVDVALLARLLGAGALLLHELVEGGEVDADAALGRHLLGDLDREAEGVVELEGDVAGHLGAGGSAKVSSSSVTPRRERGAEAALLALDDAEHEVAVGGEVGVGVAHRVDARRDEARERGVLHAEQVGEAHGPADEAAQHVAAVLVATARRRRSRGRLIVRAWSARTRRA